MNINRNLNMNMSLSIRTIENMKTIAYSVIETARNCINTIS